MLRLLIDTGPLVAWLDRRDRDHARVSAFLAGFRGRLLTTWPVLTEVCHLIPAHLVPRFLRWVADASLVWLGERTGVTDVLTLDERDFGVYRLAGGQRFRDVLASGQPGGL